MSKACPQCGVELRADALEGLCPACLLHQGISVDLASQPRTAATEPLRVEEVGKLFPQLEILALIGKGGMGAVYKARQPNLDRYVALKLLPSQGSGKRCCLEAVMGKEQADQKPSDTASGTGRAHFAERFNREARALARLSHPNIVTVHEFGHVDGMPFFIMEFVDGVNLRELQKARKLSAREAMQIIPQICDALQYAHDQGVVHRDIKPENVLLDRKGRVKIADFGLAKIFGADSEENHLTGEGQVMGTPHYMAPEQIEHPAEVDHRADIFSLGVVFYELLTGELPLGKFAPPSQKFQLDIRLDEVVLRTLEKKPERRYQQVSQVKDGVEAISTPGTKAIAPKRSRRFFRKVALPSLSALALIVIGMNTRLAARFPYRLVSSKSEAIQGEAQKLDSQPPVVVGTRPVSGSHNVSPGVMEISVTFSKEMMDESWSWSTAWLDSDPEGVGAPYYLSDHRTCVAKVRLEPGKTYAYWLNSYQFGNFRDRDGRSAVPYLLIFQTRKEGAP